MSNPFLSDSKRERSEQFYELSTSQTSALIASVDEDSPASDAGLEAGDAILKLNGEPLTDILDWMWRADGEEIEIEVLPKDESEPVATTLMRVGAESWGIDFENLVFDGIRRCANACTFCFMTQLPKGMRHSLYVRDDDYRLSFLQGNFVTLTNLNEADIERIISQNISPLNVSFHAYDEEVRKVLIGRNAPRGIEAFERLAQSGIEMNIQIVLVPQVNDGEVLEETLEWLAKYKEQIPSIGIVPVAYTKETKEIAGHEPRSYTSKIEAATVISRVQRHQFRERGETGRTWVHLADEFYIIAEAPFPQAEWYDGFPQYENGIGITISFIEEVRENLKKLEAAVKRIPLGSNAVTLVLGYLSFNTLIGVLEAVNAGSKVRILPIPNRFFGGNVSVSGLLTGEDIIYALKQDSNNLEKPTTYVLPEIIFNADGLTLDGYTKEEIVRQSEADIVFIEMGARALSFGLRDAYELTKARTS